MHWIGWNMCCVCALILNVFIFIACNDSAFQQNTFSVSPVLQSAFTHRRASKSAKWVSILPKANNEMIITIKALSSIPVFRQALTLTDKDDLQKIPCAFMQR